MTDKEALDAANDAEPGERLHCYQWSTGRMTKHARAVLLDCEGALAELREVSHDLLRRRWITMLALLRAVGHVLLIVDGKTDPVSKKIIRRRFKHLESTKPEPQIFWNFIKRERDNILKEYQFAVRGNQTIVMPPPGGHIVDPAGSRFVAPRFEIELKSGPFEGQDPMSVVRNSIQSGATISTKSTAK